MRRRNILETRIRELEARLEQLTEKLNLVTAQRDRETRAEEKMRMDAVISETEVERAQSADAMEKLAMELAGLDVRTPSPYPSPRGEREYSLPLEREGGGEGEESGYELANRCTSRSKGPVNVFYSYSHKDEALRDKLNTHLKLLERQGAISGWHDRKISAGREWAHEISKHLEVARIILLLVSSDFLASDYIHDIELKRAMARHDSGEARVIPIILRDCDWSLAAFRRLQCLPKDARPITSWPNQDAAFADIARGIREVAGELAKNS